MQHKRIVPESGVEKYEIVFVRFYPSKRVAEGLYLLMQDPLAIVAFCCLIHRLNGQLLFLLTIGHILILIGLEDNLKTREDGTWTNLPIF